MRHGRAIRRDEPGCPADPLRELTADGEKRTRAAAAGLRVLGLRPKRVLTSPYRRALRTAELVVEVLGLPRGVISQIDALAPAADPRLLFRKIKRLDEDVICFGHAPHLDDAIALAVGASRPFTALRKAGAACVALARLDPPVGELLWVNTAKALRKLGAR